MKYSEQMKSLRETKLRQTEEKRRRLGPMDEDDYGWVLPPEDYEIKLPVVDGDGMFHGVRAWSTNFRYLMEHHPVYIDPCDALAGRWMYMMSRMRPNYKLELSPFGFDYSHLRPDQIRYDITPGIGKDAHFAPDYTIGLELGWSGLLRKVRTNRDKLEHSLQESAELYDAEEDAILGVQNLIQRTAQEAEKQGLEELARINYHLVNDPPRTLREACQWIAWFNISSRVYNRDGAGGQLDALLQPYYERDKNSGLIDDEDAVFYLFCLLLNDPHYYQIGGPDETGADQTSEISYLILRAARELKSSCNITIRVHEGLPGKIFDEGVHCLISERQSFPRFSGDEALCRGFMKNGYSVELARKRIALGCNWMSLPGLEYCMNDLVKINFAKVFEVAWKGKDYDTTEMLYQNFLVHLQKAVNVTGAGIAFHLEHQWENEPELLLNLLSHGPMEEGLDASHGGAQYYNIAIDGAALGTVSDCFAALEQRVDEEHVLSFDEISRSTENNFEDDRRLQRLLKLSRKYGGSQQGDLWARRIVKDFSGMVRNEAADIPFVKPVVLIPGLFSWADTVRFGKNVGALPNGRYAGEPISHGANPSVGFRKDGAVTALVKAVAQVQPGYGNTAPLQLEVDFGNVDNSQAADCLKTLIRSHFELGGTLMNINIVDEKKILAASRDPDAYPDLIVRVTGFTAYFANLSPDFRKLVLDRIVSHAS
ncbi:MAG: pyruvate formate lyase family protein [Kiritimatiellia bacterium]